MLYNEMKEALLWLWGVFPFRVVCSIGSLDTFVYFCLHYTSVHNNRASASYPIRADWALVVTVEAQHTNIQLK